MSFFQAVEKGLKAAIFQKDYKTDLKQKTNLTVLLRNLSNDERVTFHNDVAELQDLIPSEENARYPKYRDPKIPHDRFNREDAKKATEIAKRILDAICERYFK